MNSLNLALLDLGSVSQPVQPTSKREPKPQDESTKLVTFSSLLSNSLSIKPAKLLLAKDLSTHDEDTKALKNKLSLSADAQRLASLIEQSLAATFFNIDAINKFPPTGAEDKVSSLAANNTFLAPKSVITPATDVLNMPLLIPNIAVRSEQAAISLDQAVTNSGDQAVTKPLISNDDTQLKPPLTNAQVKPAEQTYAEPMALLNLAVAKHLLPNIISNGKAKVLNTELAANDPALVIEDTSASLAISTPTLAPITPTLSGQNSIVSTQIAALENVTNQNLSRDNLTIKAASPEKQPSITNILANIIAPIESTTLAAPTNTVALKLRDILVHTESETKLNTQQGQVPQNEVKEINAEDSKATSLPSEREPKDFASMLTSRPAQTELAPEVNSKSALTNAPLQVLEHIEREFSHNSEADMRLHISLKPEHLGQVEVELVRATSGEWDVRMVAQSQTTHQVLSSEIDNLRVHLEQLGLHISQLAVSTNLNQDGQPSQQPSSYQLYYDLPINEAEVTSEPNESARLLSIRI